MKIAEKVLGLELTPASWRAVYLEARLTGTRVLGTISQALPESPTLAASTAAALETACHTLGVAPGTRLSVALARPIASVKRITLPKARRAVILEAIQKQSRSLFPLGKRAVIADVRWLPRNGRSKAAGRQGVTAAVPKDVMEALTERARALGLSFVAADVAAGAVRVVLPRGADSVVLAHELGLERVDYEKSGGIRESRYFPFGKNGNPQAAPSTALAPALAGLNQSTGWRQPLLLGAGEVVAALRGTWPGSDEAGEAPPRTSQTQPALEQGEFAIAYAAGLEAFGARPLFDLRLDHLRRADVAMGRRRTARLVLAVSLAAALFLFADFLRVRTEVIDLEREVRTMRPQAEAVLPIREASLDANALAEDLERLEADQPRWSAIIAELALTLPLDTYLTDLSARGTVLQIEGHAVRTSTVVNAFQNSRTFGLARLAGPMTREQTPAGERERFIFEVPLDRGEPMP